MKEDKHIIEQLKGNKQKWRNNQNELKNGQEAYQSCLHISLTNTLLVEINIRIKIRLLRFLCLRTVNFGEFVCYAHDLCLFPFNFNPKS